MIREMLSSRHARDIDEMLSLIRDFFSSCILFKRINKFRMLMHQHHVRSNYMALFNCSQNTISAFHTTAKIRVLMTCRYKFSKLFTFYV